MRLIKLYSLLLCFVSYSFSDVTLKSIQAGAAVEYGQMRNLKFLSSGNAFENDFTINRTIGWFVQKGTINERLDITISMAGLFFHPFPYQLLNLNTTRSSAVSLGEVSGKWKLGNISNPVLTIRGGLFPYKYNNFSQNLGEYMFRSTPYATTTINGSWDIINSSFSKLKGLHIEYNTIDNIWKNEFLLSLSDEFFPINDLSISWISKLYVDDVFEMGVGVNFKSAFPGRPSENSLEEYRNSYFDYNGTTYIGDPNYYNSLATSVESVQGDTTVAEQYRETARLVDSLNRADTVGAFAEQRYNRKYYTFQGTILMAYAGLNLGKWMDSDLLREWSIYGEVSVIGVKNYPILYEKRVERIPVMLGMSFPTLGIVDYLKFEVEYWKNPYPISTRTASSFFLPHPSLSEFEGAIDLTQSYTKDDIKWSIATQLPIGKKFSIQAQVANDHTRPIDVFFKPFDTESLLEPSSWYYLLRLQASI